MSSNDTNELYIKNPPYSLSCMCITFILFIVLIMKLLP